MLPLMVSHPATGAHTQTQTHSWWNHQSHKSCTQSLQCAAQGQQSFMHPVSCKHSQQGEQGRTPWVKMMQVRHASRWLDCFHSKYSFCCDTIFFFFFFLKNDIRLQSAVWVVLHHLSPSFKQSSGSSVFMSSHDVSFTGANTRHRKASDNHLLC